MTSEEQTAAGDPPRDAPLEGILERVDGTAREEDEVSVADVLAAAGHRSLAPLLLLPSLVMVAPVIGDIPGVPTVMGMLVVLGAGQLLAGRRHIWLPGLLLDRSVKRDKVRKTVAWLEPVSRCVDRWSKPRLGWLLGTTGTSLIAVTGMAIALATPLMEVVPFSANLAGAAIAVFGLALFAQDGLLALIALAASAGTFWMVAVALL